MENVMNIYEGVENRQVSGRGVGTEMMDFPSGSGSTGGNGDRQKVPPQ